MKIRIYQIKMEPKNCGLIFRSYNQLMARTDPEIPVSAYEKVFDGTVEAHSLEEIFYIFNMVHPKGYQGRSLSVSDVVELVSETESAFFFCDTVGFKKIDFPVEKMEESLK